MRDDVKISVVIPTCNRKVSLLRLLESLNRSGYHLQEVIVVDSGDQSLSTEEIVLFHKLNIQLIRAELSVCIQRNIGIRMAQSEWIFICDDDLEVPSEYTQLLVNHIKLFPKAGAVSGVVMQKEKTDWCGEYPVVSATSLIWRFIFQLSIWGEISIKKSNWFINGIITFYKKRANHISKAGWPVITEGSTDFFKTTIYGLGASLVRKEWLMNSLYDEILDSHGIGDNYGVAIGFPEEGIHVVKRAIVYHHQETDNRLPLTITYFRRVLALDYFFHSKDRLKTLSHNWFLWSLVGNWLGFIFTGKKDMARATRKAMQLIITQKNPYRMGSKNNSKVIEPFLDN